MYSYIALNLIFFLPVLLALVYYRHCLKGKRNRLYIAGCIGVIYFLIVDIFATSVKAWEYDYTKTLGIRFRSAVIEELIWMVLVFITVACVIEIYFSKKNNGTQ